ncbi:hypothetical protein [Flavobacterium caeni]|uniref:Uncharacterized protein n=1 Tax=Flavobacterium caeni TaxID=490189 RepID=A0A1G5AW71_9FLAO|nr:hypothetical protein [Flavobacterium caeni]SCX82080.1 hypothetical protein SAMN02927903_00173 [Flavobacterium caeni]
MKSFLIKLTVFVLIGAAAFHLKSYLLLRNDKYQRKVSAREVYHVIGKSQQKNPSRKVLIGDSVARQFFNSESENDTLNSLASNQAISLAGQYILLDNYLKAGNVIDTCYAVFIPSSFQNNLQQLFTYNYFVKPFYKDQYKPLLTETVKNQVEKIPYHGVAQYFGVLTNNWAPEFVSDDQQDYAFFSPVSVEYIHKMSALAKAKHFKLIFVPAVCNENQRKNIESFDKTELAKNHIEQEFAGYFDHIQYVDSKEFVDDMHLHAPEKFIHLYQNQIR